MSLIVSSEKLTKKYGGRTVVADLDLRVPEGCVYGFLGPNGRP
jgi:ABC-2 type transport system ATP-binding protein